MKAVILFILLLLFVDGYSQSNFAKFKKLDRHKKWWVIWHPFKAKRALKISNETKRISDSISKTSTLDKDKSGGQVDAFRHVFWMAFLHQKIGKRSARSLGKAHEKDNFKTYQKRKLEDGVIPDKISSEMDLFNNELGLSLTQKREKISKTEIINRVIDAILKGKAKIIKKDSSGEFYTCDGEFINRDSIRGKWKNNKCLVPSNSSTPFIYFSF